MSIHWIKHDGNGLPVPEAAQVVALRRDGSKAGSPAGEIAGWEHVGEQSDIVEFTCNADELIANTLRHAKRLPPEEKP